MAWNGNDAQPDALQVDHEDTRKAVTELLFFSSVGDLDRCKKIIYGKGLKLGNTETADYDKRTPLHLACAEGCHSVAAWLISQGAPVNAVDRFQRTPLEDAVRGDHGEVASLLLEHGGKIVGKDGEMLELADSPLAGNVRIFTDYDPDWEIDPSKLKMEDQIGEGEFGVVYKASWLGTTVAVKVVKNAGQLALADFRTELNVLQKVHHTHAVLFLGAVTKSQPFMIVTEFMSGGSLTDLFKGGKCPKLWRAVELALDMARGLAYLHNRQPHAVIHRDLKPANLMLGGHKMYNSYHKQLNQQEMGVLKLADFGLSKSLRLNRKPRGNRASLDGWRDGSTRRGEPPPPEPNLAASPSLAVLGLEAKAEAQPAELTDSYKMTGETGSYRYMAPEVYRHEPYNNKVDVYSFAMICYQLFEGVLPFCRYPPLDAAQAACILGKRPEWSSRPRNGTPVPKKLRDLMEQCWAMRHEDRPEFDEIIEVLEEISEELPKRPT